MPLELACCLGVGTRVLPVHRQTQHVTPTPVGMWGRVCVTAAAAAAAAARRQQGGSSSRSSKAAVAGSGGSGGGGSSSGSSSSDSSAGAGVNNHWARQSWAVSEGLGTYTINFEHAGSTTSVVLQGLCSYAVADLCLRSDTA
jgi:hypothetical protein